MALIDLVANVATVLTLLSFLSGISICHKIYQLGSTGQISSLPFLIGTLNGYLWLRYGLILKDPLIIWINIIGLTLQSTYLLWYYLYTWPKRQLNRRIISLLMFGSFVHLYIMFANDASNMVGSSASMSSLFFCASGLPTVYDIVTKSKCTENLSLPLVLSSFMAASMWLTYGYLIGDIFVQIPNFFGSLLLAIQLSLFAIYPGKRIKSE